MPVRVNSLEGDAPFRYLRLREPPYDEAALAGWADRLRPLLDDGVASTATSSTRTSRPARSTRSGCSSSSTLRELGVQPRRS